MKTIYMSGYLFEDDPLFADTLQPGRRFLPKPFTIATVLDMIGEALS
jgi:hypothetical protein